MAASVYCIMAHCWVPCRLILLLLIEASFRLTNAGDFALVADLENGTIYTGGMGQALADLAPLPLSGVRRPVAVDYDPVEKMVYWSDLQGLPSPKISKAHLNGSNQVTLVDNLRLPDGLALDVESRTMYWTDGVLGHIGRIAMDGSGSREIIIDNLDKPRTIVVDHDGGHIYWTDWGDNPQIERADLDGRNRMTVVQGDLHWPNGVFISEGNLYWCDAFLDKIERSDLSGNNRRDISTLPGLHPFDLAVYNGDVYWTDWKARTLVRVHVSGIGKGNFGPERFEKAGGLHIQEVPDYCGSSPCINGATCVDVVNEFSCQCPSGFQGTTCADFAGCVLTIDPSNIVSSQQAVYLPGDSVEYACPDGYQLSGSAVRVCRPDFTWSGRPTECIPEVAGCVLSPNPSGLLLVVSDQQAVYPPGDSVEYACPDGYQLSGSAVQYCRSDFTWSGQLAECLLQDHCDGGPCANGGTCGSTPAGFTCQCIAGYDGPTCTVVVGCVLTPDPSDVLIVPEWRAVYSPGDLVEYACPDGYQLSGSAVGVCKSDFTWSGQPAKCISRGKQEGAAHARVVAIVAGGGGAFLVVVLVFVLFLFKRRRRSRNREDTSAEGAVYLSYAKDPNVNEPIYQKSIF